MTQRLGQGARQVRRSPSFFFRQGEPKVLRYAIDGTAGDSVHARPFHRDRQTRPRARDPQPEDAVRLAAHSLPQKGTRDSIVAAAALHVHFDTDLRPFSLLNLEAWHVTFAKIAAGIHDFDFRLSGRQAVEKPILKPPNEHTVQTNIFLPQVSETQQWGWFSPRMVFATRDRAQTRVRKDWKSTVSKHGVCGNRQKVFEGTEKPASMLW